MFSFSTVSTARGPGASPSVAPQGGGRSVGSGMLLEGACMEGSPPCPLGVSSVSSDSDFGFQSLAPPVDELTRSPHLQPMEKL